MLTMSLYTATGEFVADVKVDIHHPWFPISGQDDAVLIWGSRFFVKMDDTKEGGDIYWSEVRPTIVVRKDDSGK